MNVYEEAVLADIARGEGKKNQKNRLKTKKTFPNALVTPAVQHRIGSLPSFLTSLLRQCSAASVLCCQGFKAAGCD